MIVNFILLIIVVFGMITGLGFLNLFKRVSELERKQLPNRLWK